MQVISKEISSFHHKVTCSRHGIAENYSLDVNQHSIAIKWKTIFGL